MDKPRCPHFMSIQISPYAQGTRDFGKTAHISVLLANESLWTTVTSQEPYCNGKHIADCLKPVLQNLMIS